MTRYVGSESHGWLAPSPHTTMRFPFILPLSALVLSLLAPSALAKEPEESAPVKIQAIASPQELTSQLKTSLAKVRSSCVAVFVGGYGSGVIISPDGLVITAAHMMRDIKDDKNFKITLEDGRSVKAKLLGFNRETDFALLQITEKSKTPWPHCELAKTSPLTGAFCFTMAHPSGRLKGRPAQVRIGRITTHSMRDDKPFYLFSDCNIQPGDSGGPLFSMDGKLIGLDSSAANILGLNIFPAIDQFHIDRNRLLKGDRWGDDEKAPDGPSFIQVSLKKEDLAKVQEEFMRRAKIQYPPTISFIQSLKNNDGAVELDQQAMVNHMPRDVIAIARNQPLSLGLDDPQLSQQLPPLPAKAVRGIPLYDGDERFAYGVAVDPQHILTKASLLPKGKAITIQSKGSKAHELKLVATDKVWDLALLRVTKNIQLPAIQWPSSKVNAVEPGDLLIAKDDMNRTIWNVATDQSRIMSKKRSIGPMKHKSLISEHRAPYPLAIRHALPLFAKDAGLPVFNQKGEFIGIHIARFSRTMGLIIPADQLKAQSLKMLAESEKAEKHTQAEQLPAK